jgi:hypothetical protein
VQLKDYKMRSDYGTLEFEGIDIGINDFLEEIEDHVILEEVTERRLAPINRESICDLLGVNRHTEIYKLMHLLTIHLSE